ncbi:MAG: undecaprenyldiphospho-muramoylpentapeptide beta-N-acetylglucosaminyltransferase [Verrucomicrobiae bacterium]|nr:undecaprenyldiphospho-muramoylpentapeptide beta-N-acetylglucosaminyltransferase [Verrucomicrobiae bacterium]NNJ43949.1 undecaprenyldiphospho-muramoylpentapeptide beta-N-acetylglucosaminyltransferase [Akkermansiaceae bacterium]
MSKKMNVLIACGGTGGHLFPGIAVAEELEKRGHSVRLLISEKKVDAEASEKYGDLAFQTVPAIAKPSTFSPKMIPFLFKLWKTVRQCRRILQHHGCDAVLGMGGFTSLPPVLAGKKLGLRTYVHDSNALPGKANRLTARWCSKVLVGFEAAARYFPQSDVVVTGTPVRDELAALPDRSAARAKYDLSAEGRAVLVMGGSQGAKRLNTLVVEAAKAMPGLQFLHITGAFDYDRVKQMAAERDGYHVLSFCDDMASAYAACDVAVCRSGASSMTELAYVAMPSILVPYPYAADDHQSVNAKVFDGAGAAVMRQEVDLDAGGLVADLTRMVEGDEVMQEMAAMADGLALRGAAGKICDEISVEVLS